LKAKYRQQLAELESARHSATFHEHEYHRKNALIASGFTSRAALERADTDRKVAQQTIAAMKQEIANTVVALSGNPDTDLGRHPTVTAAQARLGRARLDLSYTEVLAPDDGVVTRVDELQVGDFVKSGEAVFALLSSLSARPFSSQASIAITIDGLALSVR
jgi:membrane fusion protein (multidrug efflux system)